MQLRGGSPIAGEWACYCLKSLTSIALVNYAFCKFRRFYVHPISHSSMYLMEYTLCGNTVYVGLIKLKVQFVSFIFKLWCILNLCFIHRILELSISLVAKGPDCLSNFHFLQLYKILCIHNNSCIFERFHPWHHSLGLHWSSYPWWFLLPFLFLLLVLSWCHLAYCQNL